MKKRKYNIVYPKHDKTQYEEVEGYTERLNLSNGLNITVGIRKNDNYWHIDDYLTGMAVTTQTFKTRKEALSQAKEILERQKDKVREAREYYIQAYNIKLNIL